MKKISINDTISISKFMRVYLGVECDSDTNFTHNKMMCYLEEKGLKLPERISMNWVTKEDIKEGRYLLVREDRRKDNGRFKSNRKLKIIAYINPLYSKLNQNIVQSKEELRNLRNKILEENGLIEDEYGNIMDLNIYKMYSDELSVTHKCNRANVLKLNRSMRKRGWFNDKYKRK